MNKTLQRWRSFLREKEVAARARRWGLACLDAFYPPHCESCQAPTAAGCYLCTSCKGEIVRIEAPRCHHCSLPFEGLIDDQVICPTCRAHPPAFDRAICAYRLTGPVREFIHRFKYEHRYHLRLPLAEWLQQALGDIAFAQPRPDCLVPVPLFGTRERERGFNQAAVVAEIAGAALGIPVRPLLRRTRPTQSQTRLEREERIENLRNAFEMRQYEDVRNLHPVLIDDVLTTGSTVNACAAVLKAAGAASVRVATIARG